MAEQYFIRWKSVVSGPYTSEAVKEMIREGKVSKHHQVSSDKVTWMPLHGSDDFSGDCRVEVGKARLATIRIGAAAGPAAGDAAARKDELGAEPGSGATESAPTPTARHVLKIRETVGPTLVEDRWYYVDKGVSEGPVPVTEIHVLVDRGIIEYDSPICREGEERWLKAGEAFPVFWKNRHTYTSPPETRWQTAERSTYGRYGGFWLRFFALFIDSFIVLLLQALTAGAIGAAVGYTMGSTGSSPEEIELVCGMLGAVVGAIVNWIYFAGGESGYSQGTVGKRAMGLMVTDLNGERITFGRASGRYFSKILSGLFFGIGYLMVAFSEKKQGLHDMMAGTLVVRR